MGRRTLLVPLVALLSLFCAVMSAVGHAQGYVRHKPGLPKIIVFVHGVLGDSTSSWTASGGTSWPQLLAQDSTFDSANIYVYGYPTPAVGQSYSINELAEHLRSRLEA